MEPYDLQLAVSKSGADEIPVPMVVSSVRLDANPTSLATVSFTVTFSEFVTVDTTHFSLTNTGSISGASVASVSGSGLTRTVSVNTGTGEGTIRLDVIDNDSIQGLTGTPLGGIGAGNGGFTAGEEYTIDRTSPTVISSTRLGSNPSTLSTVSFLVTFSEAVTGVDLTDFALTNTGTIAGASISGVTGSDALEPLRFHGYGSGQRFVWILSMMTASQMQQAISLAAQVQAMAASPLAKTIRSTRLRLWWFRAHATTQVPRLFPQFHSSLHSLNQ